MRLTEADPKGLVRESYRIDGITLEECRSIFIDWALSLPVTADVPDAIRTLLAAYGSADPQHPMEQVLRDGLAAAPQARRRGGRAARVARI
ncbi:MAG: hypothetical protein IOC92_07500 [Rhodobacter sp.]|nr:hypothetical protein [Rhodobacter sp.]MCA3455821.1 hypothetical protein [Rhodobacter sp.]MCA3459832.1 hypothetical protein [Rhodobacter sp.]MCA3463547.1 hypothetical protein [Rhodobacter sp.]MCA3468237.1 hypothetical protein [Rhodobacter sp.]